MYYYQIFQVLAVLLTGLVAGLLYGFECSVTKGLGQLGNKEYLMAFQSINKAILNPYFFACFIGCLFVLPIASWLSFNTDSRMSFYFLLFATSIYFLGVFGITIFGNVPLNESLQNFNIDTASTAELFSHRKKFENSWNQYHLTRTIAAILSFLATIISFLKIE